MSPSARGSISAGGASDLESLKSGKDRTKLWCALKFAKTVRNFTAPEPPTTFENVLSRFRDDYSSAFARATHLLFADLIAFVAAGL